MSIFKKIHQENKNKNLLENYKEDILELYAKEEKRKDLYSTFIQATKSEIDYKEFNKYFKDDFRKIDKEITQRKKEIAIQKEREKQEKAEQLKLEIERTKAAILKTFSGMKENLVNKNEKERKSMYRKIIRLLLNNGSISVKISFEEFKELFYLT